jgi:hypothetical protein
MATASATSATSATSETSETSETSATSAECAPTANLPATTIKRVATQLLMEALGAPADTESVAKRAADAEQRFPEFARMYPTLVTVCCGATTRDAQAQTRRMLVMMMDRLASIGVKPDGSLDAADVQSVSATVGRTIYKDAGIL